MPTTDLELAARARDGPRPRRPLLELGLASALGSQLGALAPGADTLACALVALTVVFATGWFVGWLAAGGGAWSRRGRAARAAFLATFALLAFSRASVAAKASLAQPLEPEGLFEVAERTSEHLEGSIENSVALELAPGSARDGETVRVLDGAPRRREARGPIEPARTRAVRGELAPLVDQIVRVAPSRRIERPWSIGRLRLLEACDRARDREASAMLRAVVCGDTSELDARTLDLFTRTGTRHLLAVSGQHVALVTSFVIGPALAFLAGALQFATRGRARFDSSYLFAALVWIYVPLAGGGSPVRRAALAFAVAGAARTFSAPRAARDRGLGAVGRRTDAWSLWGAALFAECAFDPLAANSLSLQLSYAATLGLLLATGPIARALAPWFQAERPRLEAERSWLRVALRRSARAVIVTLAASFAAVLATVSISWATFGEFSVFGAIATAVAIPLFAWMLAVGWVLALSPWSLPVAPFEWGARSLTRVLELCDRLPGTPLELPPRPAWLLHVAVALTFVAIVCAARDSSGADRSARELGASSGVRRGQRWAASAFWLWSGLLLPWTARASQTELHAMDVGHGTAVVIRPRGGRPWIYDAGSRDRLRVGSGALAPLLRVWDEDDIDVALSHTDRDHCSALGWICERFRAHLWAGALTQELEAAQDDGLDRLDLDSGSVRGVEGDVGFAWRLARGGRLEGNEGSRAFVVEERGGRWILLGDCVESGLAGLLRSGALNGPCDVLLLPHHGGASAWLGALLETAQPREVWVSADDSPASLAELERRGIPWRSTARDGPLFAQFAARCAAEWHGSR